MPETAACQGAGKPGSGSRLTTVRFPANNGPYPVAMFTTAQNQK